MRFMKSLHRFLLLLVCLSIACAIVPCCWFISPAAADPTLTSEISPRHGELDDLFLFTVKVTDAQNLSKQPQLLNNIDFEATYLGPQTSISIVNGVVDSRMAYVYQLQPKRAGTLKTPRVELEHGGKVLVAPEIQVQVDGANAGSSAQASPNDRSAKTSDRLFIRQTATPTKVYQGQQVINSLSLFTRVELAEFNIEDFSTDGFWQERFIDNDRSTTEVKGLEYTRLEHAKALYPLSSGTFTLPARRARAKVIVRARRQLPSFFDLGDSLLQDLFETVQLKEVSLTSEPLTIEVLPLPPAPPELTPIVGSVPIVGETSLKAVFSSDPISAGEVKTVAYELTTTGNLHPHKSITLAAPAGVKVYEEAPETTSVPTGTQVKLKRTFRFSIVPLHGGIVTIPPARIAYFDPHRREFLTASSAEVSFPVNGPSPQPAPQQQPPSQAGPADPVIVGGLPTLPPVPVAPELEYREPSWAQRINTVVSVQLALLITAAAIGLSTLALVAARRLRGRSRPTVTAATVRALSSTVEVERALRSFLKERIGGPLEDVPYEQLRAHVRTASPTPELTHTTCSLIDELEAARYGGRADDQILDQLKTRFRTILTQW